MRFLILALALAITAPAAELTGDWYGTLDTGAQKLRLIFHVTKNADGSLGTTIESIDQGPGALPGSAAKIDGSKITLEYDRIRGAFEGTANEAGTEIDGTWSQGGGSLALKLTRTKFPPDEKVDPIPLTATERDFLVSHLEKSRKEFFAAITGLSPGQWQYKPSSGGWSVAECAEHLVLTEDRLYGLVTGQLIRMPVRKVDRKGQPDDEAIIARMLDRSQKAQAVEALRPSGKYDKPEAVIAEFNPKRDRSIEFVKTTREDLRGRVAGQMDVYQYLVTMSAHTLRHTAQINEVKADPKYPK